MTTRARLAALAHDLRHARTRFAAMSLVERAQHLIVRIEELLAAGRLDGGAADRLEQDATALLAELNPVDDKPKS